MAEVNQVYKKAVLSRKEVVKYQLLSYCFFTKKEGISDADIDCIVLMALSSLDELHLICDMVCSEGVFKTPQSVRNSLNKMEKKGLIAKQGKNKKKVKIAVDLVTRGNILLNYNFLSIETTEG